MPKLTGYVGQVQIFGTSGSLESSGLSELFHTQDWEVTDKKVYDTGKVIGYFTPANQPIQP